MQRRELPERGFWNATSAPASTVILGRAVKNEYLTLGTLFTVAAGVMLAGGGKKDTKPPTLQQVKESVKIGASSNIKNFIAEAEKESGSKH
ncbi:uncharacterized protein BXZ73DRAFT_98453 [Epithele typhae]|uniref:uncharacterized protein n=1 Tax=Epithele typhae TaxID=378194 RepID=UPI002007C515|nr:uncharacterized protein BXZ73DRAFT_98453 [Epithele typhae]KAH9941239.1 hypothetical protein BXZ73DRAFT_98453 [Epithele typhae]